MICLMINLDHFGVGSILGVYGSMGMGVPWGPKTREVPTNSTTLDRTMPCSPFPKSHFPSYVVCLDVCGLHSQSWVVHDIVFADMNREVSMGVHYLGVAPNHPFLDGIFSELNHPAMGVPPWKPPDVHHFISFPEDNGKSTAQP